MFIGIGIIEALALYAFVISPDPPVRRQVSERVMLARPEER